MGHAGAKASLGVVCVIQTEICALLQDQLSSARKHHEVDRQDFVNNMLSGVK